MAKPFQEDASEERYNDLTQLNRDEIDQQQQKDQRHGFCSSENYSSDEFSVSSDEDWYSHSISVRHPNVEIINEGNNNKERIKFLPKSGIRRSNSLALLNEHKMKAGLNQDNGITRVESAPILLPSKQSIPEFLTNRMRKAELAEVDTNNVSKATISLQSTEGQPMEGPATKHLEKGDPRVVYSQILEKHGICSRPLKAEELDDFFVEMREANVTGYTMDKVTAMRTEDITTLRCMHSQGETLQVCNRFGESIIHSACRRGLQSVIHFLVEEAGVSLAVKDDFGKTPAHDACWTIKPNFEVVHIVVTACPDLFLVPDKRGSLPLDYTQKSLWSEWCAFLRDNEDKLIPKQLRQNLIEPVGEAQQN